MKNRIAAVLMMMVLVFTALGVMPVSAQNSDTIVWTEEESWIYDQIHPYTLNWTGDVLDRGGLNLWTMEYTAESSEADIVINQYGDIGGLAIRKLTGEKLTDPTKRYTTGFTNSLKMTQGDIYLVTLQDGTYAKMRIDRILPDNGYTITQVKFSIVYEALEEEQQEPADQPFDIGSPAADILQPVAEYVFEGDGSVTIPWDAEPGEVLWDIYRSDNGAPYVKTTDFPLTETEYTDHYTFVGHTYLYKLVSYDSNEQPLGISAAIKVTIVPIGAGTSDPSAPPAAPENLIVLQLGNKTAYVNNKAHELEVAPFTFNGRTVVPLRFVSESLGATVKWNGQEKSITLTMGQDTIVLVLDKSAAKVNGKNVTMDVPAFIKTGITMVPIRFVSEQLRQNVAFDNPTKKIIISTQAVAGPASSEGSSAAGGNSGNSGQGAPASGNAADYFIGSWKMWVPAGIFSADGGTLTIYADGTTSYYWNGPQTGTWELDEAAGTLLLSNYKSGWEWTATRTDTGITVSSWGVYETGVKAK